LSESVLLSGKYRRVELPEVYAPRKGLVSLFNRGAKKRLIVVAAPAGSGKTVAAQLWLEGSGRRAVFIGLDLYDNTPSVFLKLCCTGILSLQPENKAMKEILSSPAFISSPIEHTIHFLSEFAPDGQEYALALENMHFVTDSELRKSALLLQRRMPLSFVTLVLTREELSRECLDLGKEGQFAVITAQDLAFSAEEIQRYCQSCGQQISPEKAEAMQGLTSGWAMGVHLLVAEGDAGSEEQSVWGDDESDDGGYESNESNGNDEGGGGDGSDGGKVNDGVGASGILMRYIKKEIWDRWEAPRRSFLLKTSIIQGEFTPELAERLTGEQKSREILETLQAAGSIFIIKTDKGYFRYNRLFLNFLRRIAAKEKAMDLEALAREAARYYYEKGKYYKAVEYYIRCGDQDGITSSLEKISGLGGSMSAEEEFNLTRRLLQNIKYNVKDEFLTSNLYLAALLSRYYFMGGELKFLFYLDILYDNLPVMTERCPRLTEITSYLGWLDFRINLKELPEDDGQKKSVTAILAAHHATESPEWLDQKNFRSMSLTFNLPFLHRSMRDFSELASAPDPGELLSSLEGVFPPLPSREYNILTDCVLAGLYYEKNMLAKGMKYALAANEKCQPEDSIELRFSVGMILTALSDAMHNNTNKASEKKKASAIRNLSDMIKKERAYFLQPNLNAYRVKIKLLNGEKEAAESWLESYLASEEGGQEEEVGAQLRLYKIFQYFTTARAFLVMGRIEEARKLILQLRKLGEDFRRPLDLGEAMILQGILQWALGEKDKAMLTLREALAALQEYGFVRVFADEGAAVLPILKKLAANLKKENNGDPPDSRYVQKIIIAAYEQSKGRKGIAVNIPGAKPVRLSRQQEHIITLLAQGYRNKEIVEITGLTIHTVKSHQSAAYAKLKVNNAMDAVLRARELGLISRR